jgi:hypothetical protein
MPHSSINLNLSKWIRVWNFCSRRDFAGKDINCWQNPYAFSGVAWNTKGRARDVGHHRLLRFWASASWELERISSKKGWEIASSCSDESLTQILSRITSSSVLKMRFLVVDHWQFGSNPWFYNVVAYSPRGCGCAARPSQSALIGLYSNSRDNQLGLFFM